MATKKLYQDDVYQKTCEAEILQVEKEEDGTWLVFDQTVFAPEGGGQPSDRGTVLEAAAPLKTAKSAFIDRAEDRGDQVFHRLTEDPGFRTGDRVILSIDWGVRFDHMQRHLGEHILSGAFWRLFGGINRGFHMGEEGMTIDIAFEGDLPGGGRAEILPDDRLNPDGRLDDRSLPDRVTWEMAEAAEFEANRVIQSDAPVSVRYFHTRDEAARMPVRKAVAFDQEISVVTVGDPAAPLDCVCCCGTHPSSAGQVGLVKIYKIEPNKGMSRVYLEAGSRALVNAQRHFNLLYELETALSAGDEDVLAKFRGRAEKEEAVHGQLTALRRRVQTQEAAAIAAAPAPFTCRTYEDLSVDDLMQIGRKAAKGRAGLLVLAQVPDRTALLFAGDGLDAGALTKAAAPAFSGRGGGKAAFARATFPDEAALRGFLTALGDRMKE